jgi:two-component system, chemotaxis family, protein-glutamate methylesterase/glutaminase
MIGVVLSGPLDDGSRGLAAIHKAGGLSMVLTPAGPPERGMPKNAIKFDGPIASLVLPKKLLRQFARPVGPSLEHRFAPRIDPC